MTKEQEQTIRRIETGKVGFYGLKAISTLELGEGDIEVVFTRLLNDVVLHVSFTISMDRLGDIWNIKVHEESPLLLKRILNHVIIEED